MGEAASGIDAILWAARLHQVSVGALYLHIPFCVRKCAYCDFSSWASDPHDALVARYVAALGRLMAQVADAGLLASCETAYVGGGTPTLAGRRLAELVAAARELAPGTAELTCEANPDSLTDELLAALPEAGCTRLSVGVQSLDDGELRELGRIHSAAQARERLAAAVDAGVAVSCDLMCATPGQTPESWRRTLAGVLGTGVGHVSVYPLQIEEGTPFDLCYGDAECPWNATEVQAQRMEQAAKVLGEAGLKRYEVASYARLGCACQHNLVYWTGVPYLGLGTGASSMLTREGYECLRSVACQLPAVGEHVARVRLSCTSDRLEVAQAHSLADLHFDLELLDEAQTAAEDLMLGMRLSEGVEPGLVEHARAAIGAGEVDEALAWCVSRNLACERNAHWMPTTQGWLLGNELYGRLWDLAPGEVTSLQA